ncbi:MAG TPA: CapA family protein [Gaiellaceae bacterium]|nr:CapA family protein [Gaiellaceae bacterium]
MTRALILAASLLVLLVSAGVTLAASAGEEATTAFGPARGPAGAGEEAQRRGRLGSGRPVVLAFGGDVHFEGVLAGKLAASPRTLLAPIRPALERADVAIVNLETAITTGGSAVAKQFAFAAPPAAFDALRGGGVDVASMANNHGLDYGESGLRDSLAAARRARFPLIGIGLDAARAYRPYRRTVQGQRIAILAATQVLDDELIAAWTAGPRKPGLASAKDVPRLVAEVRRARASADTVVVFLHWGRELERCPTDDQRSLARALVRAGADVVVGGHAHRLLGTGRLGAALVSYGLGNFVWYGTSELSTRTGVLLVTVTGRRVDGYRWVPARIVDGVPRPLAGAEAREHVAAWRSLRGCAGLRP